MSSKHLSNSLQSYLHPRLRFFRWSVPLLLLAFVIIYEVGPARWLYVQWGPFFRTVTDVLIFGVIGPFFAFTLLYFLERWLDERDTADLQMHILNRVQAEVQNGRELHDDALQVLFAASMLIDSLKSALPQLPDDTTVQIEITEAALQQAIHQLRSHLLNNN